MTLTDIWTGVNRETEMHREKRETENPCLLFGSSHGFGLVPAVGARWFPSPSSHVFEARRREEDQEWHVEQGSTA